MKGPNIISYCENKKLHKENPTQWVLLGEGGINKVYLAEFKNTLVAVKALTTTSYIEDRIKEVRQLSHGNLVKIEDFIITHFEKKTYRFLIMELMDTDLFHIILKEKAESPSNFWNQKGINIAIDIICGLEYLHNRGIIHKDIKSPNIFIKFTSDGTMVAKVGDLDNIRKEEIFYVRQSAQITPQYASPEQFLECEDNNNNNLTVASDIYSFGVLLWEIGSLEQPWDKWEHSKIREGVIMGQFLVEHQKYITNILLLSIITHCCKVDPTTRTKTAKVKDQLIFLKEQEKK